MNTNDDAFKSSGYDDEQHDMSAMNFGAPLTLGSNDEDVWKGSSQQAPTQLDAFNPLSGFGAAPMMAKGQQQTGIHLETMSMPMGGLGGLDAAPLSFGAPMDGMMKAPLIQVLPTADNDFSSMDFSEFKQPAAFFVPSKCGAPSGLQPTPMFYNEMTSIVVDESPEEVLEALSGILSASTNDIDFRVDAAKFEIMGQVFVRNLAVFFRISVWDEGSGSTRMECRRTKGDTVAFNEFWNRMQEALYRHFPNAMGNGQEDGDDDDEEEDGMQFGALQPLDYNLTLDLDDLDQDEEEEEATGLTPRHLNDFVGEMKQSDPAVVYSIAMLIDALQATTASMLLSNAAFIHCVIESVLTHQDTALVRGALVMLSKLCDASEGGADILMGYKVLERVIPLLNHDVDLIRKYAVRLLCKLCAAKSWTLENAKLKAFAEFSVKECRAKWQDAQFATSDFIETQMFDDIHNKLISVQ